MPLSQIAHLTDDDLDTQTGTPGFSQLMSDTVGDDATAADGFDALLNSTIFNFADDDVAFDALDEALTAADFVEGDFSAQVLQPLEALVSWYATVDPGIPDF